MLNVREKLARLRPQFSMRTLLIVVLSLCAALAVFDWATREARRKRGLENAWLKRGASVFFNDDGQIDGVAFTDRHRDFAKEDVRLLKQHPGIAILLLSNTKVTDGDLQLLEDLPKLHALLLSNTSVTDAGMQHLTKLPSLQFVILDGTNVTDDGLECLLELPNIRCINLENTQVTPQRIDKLRADAPDFGLLY